MSSLNKKPWFCPSDFHWAVSWLYNSWLIHVPPHGHVGKRLSLFQKPHCAIGQGNSEVSVRPSKLLLMLSISYWTALGRLLLCAWCMKMPVRAVALPTVSLNKCRGVKPGTRSRNKMCVSWLCVPCVLTHCISSPKSCAVPSLHPKWDLPQGQSFPPLP